MVIVPCGEATLYTAPGHDTAPGSDTATCPDTGSGRRIGIVEVRYKLQLR